MGTPVAIGPPVRNAGERDLLRTHRNNRPTGERAWIKDGACQNLRDPTIFFVGRGEDVEFAKRICRSCKVRSECLDWALTNRALGGIWGGMSERERKKLNRGRK